MKSFTLLALVAGASATFKGANPFTCPSNTDNQCEEKQKPGFNWFDMPLGPISNYDKFKFKGWECKEDGNFKRRGQFDRRTPNKVIGGTCFPEKPKCPSFGSPDKFSLDKIHVSTEFDCDLEFHYDMPDGSLCRHRAPCKKGGSKIKNTQCGGAKNVTIIYPPQPNKPKPSCSVTVTSIDFECGPPKSTSTRPATTSTKPATTTKPGVSTTPGTSKPATSPVPSTNTPPASQTTPPASQTTPPASQTTPPASQTTPPATETKPTSPPASETKSTSPPASETKPTSPPASETKPTTPPVISSSSSSTVTTVFQSTSTVFTTSVSTIISCSENVSECPGKSSTTVVTVTVPVSTTICPVTETKTLPVTSATQPAGTSPAGGSSTTQPAGTSPAGGSSTTQPAGTSPAGGSSTTQTPVGGVSSSSQPPNTIATTTKPAGPVETLPCPDVVPQCLNTWIFQLGCKDNTDTDCYCPDKLFAENVFQCFYAHGQTDTIVSQAIVFFQGICAPHIPNNPAIVTAPTVTSYITVTPAPTVTNPAAITTIVVSETRVVPCTDDEGSTIPNSSTTVTINTSVTVPKLGFTTGTDASATSVVGLVPVTTPLSAVAPTGPANTGVFVPTASSPAGTGPARPGQTSPVVVAAGGRVQAGAAGLAGLAAMAIAALL